MTPYSKIFTLVKVCRWKSRNRGIETQKNVPYLECQAELQQKVQTNPAPQSYRGGESGLWLRLESKKIKQKNKYHLLGDNEERSYVMATEDCFYCSHLDIGSKIPNLFLNIFQNQVIASICDPC